MPDPEHLALERALPGREHAAEVGADRVADRVGVDAASGARIAVTVQLSSSPSPNRSRPIAWTPSFTARLSIRWRVERRVDAVLEVQLERGVQPLHHADRGRPRVLGVGQRRERPVDHASRSRTAGSWRSRPPRGARAHRHERDAGAAPTAPSASRRRPRRRPSRRTSNGHGAEAETRRRRRPARRRRWRRARAPRSAGSRRSRSRTA